MTQAVKLGERPTVDAWVKVFLCELVMLGKTEIYVRERTWSRGKWAEERDRMQALYEYLQEHCDDDEVQKDRDWFFFAVQLRNSLSPGNTGSFEIFLHEIRRKMHTIIDLNFPDCVYYSIKLGKASAQSHLEHADERLRVFAKACADIYMA